MTDNEIINQWKHERELAECVCSYFVDQVELSLVNETIALINCQKAEIERLKECPKCIYEYRGEMVEYCIQGPCSKFKTANEIKSEAYKEFAERLQSICKEIIEIKWNETVAPVSWSYAYDNFIDDINKLLKEMVGKNK